ncbi:hypothetical protein JW948_16850 [bacterium]|nr:hypothetical protein [bacterium]
MRRKICLPVLFLCAWAGLTAQPGSLRMGQLIDVPIAKTLFQGEMMAELRMYSRGGLLSSILVGLTDRIGMGVSYGGENIIGMGKVNMNPQPAVHVQYLVISEENLSPGVIVGFNSQGLGAYNKSLKRYAVKSRGLYAAASKNTSFLGGLGMHGGLNWSLENEDRDNDPNLFIGFHKWINPELCILADYDTAVNDNQDKALGSGKGYLNAAVQWSFNQTLYVEFDWKNILENGHHVPGSSREIKLIYITHL